VLLDQQKLLGHKCKILWLRLAMLQVSLQLSPCFDSFFLGPPKKRMANSQNWPSCGSPTRACQAACGAAVRAGGLRFCLIGAHFPISQLVWAPETVTEKLHLRNEFVVPKKGSLFRLSFIMTSDVIHLLTHCKYIECVYIYIYIFISIYLIYMCVCVWCITLLYYMYI